MIPYVEWTQFHIGPLTLYVWGLFVALGFIIGGFVSARFAKSQGLKEKIIYDLLIWVILAGIIGGRLGYIFFYDASEVLENPAAIFAIWNGGMSVFGGLIGALITAILYLKKKKVDVFRYAEASLFGLPIGLWIGRIGCFLIHDHPGTATDFALGVEYPDGVIRHDHGLYLSLNGLAMAIVFFWLARKKRPLGIYISVFMIWYGIVRFILDFYRINEVKYAGLTPGQYLAACLFVAGLWVAFKMRGRKQKQFWQPFSINKH